MTLQRSTPQPNDLAEDVRALVARLPEADREVIDLHYFAGLSQAEVATAVGASENTVSQRLSRARSRLRDLLGARGAVVTTTVIASLLAAQPAYAASPQVVAAAGSIAASAAGGNLPTTTVRLTVIQKIQLFMSTRPAAAGVAVGLIGIACCLPFVLRGADQRPVPNRAIFPAPVAAVNHVVATKTDSITQYGITWTFAEPVASGQFVNGDYWVLGPVVINAVSPGWDGVRHGSMVDPVPSAKQGYRQEWKFSPKYDETLRATFPLRLEGVRSLVSTIGMESPRIGGAYEGLETAAVLTVVDKIPPADAFRPPYVAGDKPIKTESQVQWKRLPKLPPPSGVRLPDVSTVMQRVWLDHIAIKGNSNATMHPRENMQPYYFGNDASTMAMMVLLDIPEREALTVRLVQLGIDLHAISMNNGDAWRGYGGFGNARRWPILFAGIMLDDQAMQEQPALVASSNSRTGTVDKFGEDAHTWYGVPTPEYPQGKPLWGNDAGNQQVIFHQLMTKGMTASGDKDIRDPDGKLDGPSFGYRKICSVTWIGPALAARLMGAQDIWKHPPFFDYVDRWVKEQGVPSIGKNFVEYCWGNEFLNVMWTTWRPKADAYAKELSAQVPITP